MDNKAQDPMARVAIAYSSLLALLDDAKHGEDCAWRCLNITGCRADHGCDVCGADADDDDEGQDRPEGQED